MQKLTKKKRGTKLIFRIMDTIRLRTMARKSVFNFGKFVGHSVQQVLNQKAYKALRWYYYCCSNISFLPDILDEIGVTEEYRIAKPGTDEDMDKCVQERKNQRFRCMLGRMTNEGNKDSAVGMCMAIKKKKKVEAKERWRKFKEKDDKRFSKGAMAWRNQGH